jgi:hypothetical protein
MQNVQETGLAWALIETSKPHLSAPEREVVFVVLGAGDTFGVIRLLFKLIVTHQIPMPTPLVHRCTTWLDTYARHEEQQTLRRLIASFPTGHPAQDGKRMRVKQAPRAKRVSATCRLTTPSPR